MLSINITTGHPIFILYVCVCTCRGDRWDISSLFAHTKCAWSRLFVSSLHSHCGPCTHIGIEGLLSLLIMRFRGLGFWSSSLLATVTILEPHNVCDNSCKQGDYQASVQIIFFLLYQSVFQIDTEQVKWRLFFWKG